MTLHTLDNSNAVALLPAIRRFEYRLCSKSRMETGTQKEDTVSPSRMLSAISLCTEAG
jgi:hypothetical protein